MRKKADDLLKIPPQDTAIIVARGSEDHERIRQPNRLAESTNLPGSVSLRIGELGTLDGGFELIHYDVPGLGIFVRRYRYDGDKRENKSVLCEALSSSLPRLRPRQHQGAQDDH